jgi:S1-C subfamily serine protease
MNWRNLFLVLGMFVTSLPAREWRSSDGSRTLEAEFAGLKDGRLLLKTKDGKSTVVAATVFSKEDQQFAQQAQVTLEAALKAKPLNFEVTQVLPEGFLCRLVNELLGQPGIWVASGAPFLVLASNDVVAERGTRVMAKTLYHAGTRTFQALDGTNTLISAYSLKFDEAVNTALMIQTASGGDPAKQAPLIVEPLMEKIMVRGLGLPIGKGHFITDAAFAEGNHPVAIHHEGKDVPATVVKNDTKRGLALLKCAGVELPAGAFIPREPVVFGQGIVVASLTLNSTRRGFEPVTMTTGIVGRLIDATLFQHDAPLVPDAVGGFVLNDRLEVIGVFFSPETRTLGARSSSSQTSGSPPTPRGITECHRSDILDELCIEGGKDKRLPGMPELKRGSIGDDKSVAADFLRKTYMLVVSAREVAKTPPPAKTAAGAMTPPGAPTGWSLSKSGTRHNSKCRFFGSGAACQATEGKACKVCGG